VKRPRGQGRPLSVLSIAVLLALLCVVGCKSSSPAPTAPVDYDLSTLVSDLQATGAAVMVAQQPVDYGFLTKGKRIEIDGAPVFAFEFADGATMEGVAGGISAQRGSITITRLEDGSKVWIHADCIGTPYLYKKGKLIVILYDHAQPYDHARARSMIRSLLGPHFAGGPWAFLSKDRQ
jgi:hypothetical protein